MQAVRMDVDGIPCSIYHVPRHTHIACLFRFNFTHSKRKHREWDEKREGRLRARASVVCQFQNILYIPIVCMYVCCQHIMSLRKACHCLSQYFSHHPFMLCYQHYCSLPVLPPSLSIRSHSHVFLHTFCAHQHELIVKLN